MVYCIYCDIYRQWGQFIDHDITLISEDKNDNDLSLDIDIYIPCGDPIFDVNNNCDASLSMNMFRTKAFNDSGTSTNNIRNQFNDITSFMDASMVYGSDVDRANELRYILYHILYT